jgi:uncharacterized membrane protein YfcA
MTLLSVFLMCLAGLLLGLLGSGGSMLIVPILVYAARVPPHQAVGLSLFIVGATSTLGCLLNARKGVADFRVGAVFGTTGMIGAWIGAKFTHLVSDRELLLWFATLMIVAGVRMLVLPANPTEYRRQMLLRCVPIGVAVGMLTGFFGVGGGFIVVPALVVFGGLQMRVAVATSLGIIALNCFAGLARQLRYVDFNLALAIALVAAAFAGMAAGVALANRVAASALRRAFATAIIILGLFLLIKNLP